MKIDSLMESLPPNYTVVDREVIFRAYQYAETAHTGQKRASGEPYVSHCLAVAAILADMHVPPAVVIAGLLHDTVEDTSVTLEDIKNEFGEEIAKLVDGVTKLTNLPRISRGDQHQEDENDDARAPAEEIAQYPGATTRAGMLTNPLRDRFGIVARLEFYTRRGTGAHRAPLGRAAEGADRRRKAPSRSRAVRAARRASPTGCCAACATTST